MNARRSRPPMNSARSCTQQERKSLLRFITCGSVDDGKSTLIGRLLYDSKLRLRRPARRAGDATRASSARTARRLDFALLVDGLAAEREQGITIDVAYRFFATARRKFIVADTPGHEQYTAQYGDRRLDRRSGAGAGRRREGVLAQTKRHAFILSMLGVRKSCSPSTRWIASAGRGRRFAPSRMRFRDLAGTRH